jgi:hypothetical protein
MSGAPEWFAAKRYGYGAGPPIAWQGWALLIGYILLISAASLLIRNGWLAYASVLTMLTVVFIVIVARTTRGGWSWRWGGKE